jgi:hypothetical protein
MVLELVVGIPGSQYVPYDSWLAAREWYRAVYDLDMLSITPIPGGFWDTPFPLVIIESDESDSESPSSDDDSSWDGRT